MWHHHVPHFKIWYCTLPKIFSPLTKNIFSLFSPRWKPVNTNEQEEDEEKHPTILKKDLNETAMSEDGEGVKVDVNNMTTFFRLSLSVRGPRLAIVAWLAALLANLVQVEFLWVRMKTR